MVHSKINAQEDCDITRLRIEDVELRSQEAGIRDRWIKREKGEDQKAKEERRPWGRVDHAKCADNEIKNKISRA